MKECPRIVLWHKDPNQTFTLFKSCPLHWRCCENKDNRIESIRQCISFLQKRYPVHAFDKILFWGHGTGWVVGTWKRPVEFLSLEELNREIFAPLQPQIVAFDACYMGSLACLFSMHTSIRYVIASPGLQPYSSFLDLASFASQEQDKKKFSVRLANEWMKVSLSATGDKERCMLVYDVKRIQKVVAPLIRHHWTELMFDKRAQINREDARIFDVWSASRHLPHVQEEIRKAILNVPPHKPIPCWRVRGLMVDSSVFRRWVHIYKKSKWAKFLGASRNRHHTIPRPDPMPHKEIQRQFKYGQWIPRNLSYKYKKRATSSNST
jgi:hypothetical protein